METTRPSGAGPGPITDDGCAVELYAELPTMGEPELLHAALPPGATVLDLGAGTGRIATPLARLGHPVTAVDASAEMLALIPGARTVLARIEDLRLAERFDAVLLASYLLNDPDPARRAALLRTCARHLAPGGRLLAQRHAPAWLAGLRVGDRQQNLLGDVFCVLEVLDVRGELVEAEVTYGLGSRQWRQHFVTRLLDDAAVEAELAPHGLRLERRLDEQWFTAAAE